MKKPTEAVVNTDTMSNRDKKLLKETIRNLDKRLTCLSVALPERTTEDDFVSDLAHIAIDDNVKVPLCDYVKASTDMFLSLAYGELARSS